MALLVRPWQPWSVPMAMPDHNQAACKCTVDCVLVDECENVSVYGGWSLGVWVRVCVRVGVCVRVCVCVCVCVCVRF